MNEAKRTVVPSIGSQINVGALVSLSPGLYVSSPIWRFESVFRTEAASEQRTNSKSGYLSCSEVETWNQIREADLMLACMACFYHLLDSLIRFSNQVR